MVHVVVFWFSFSCEDLPNPCAGSLRGWSRSKAETGSGAIRTDAACGEQSDYKNIFFTERSGGLVHRQRFWDVFFFLQ